MKANHFEALVRVVLFVSFFGLLTVLTSCTKKETINDPDFKYKELVTMDHKFYGKRCCAVYAREYITQHKNNELVKSAMYGLYCKESETQYKAYAVVHGEDAFLTKGCTSKLYEAVR